MRHLTREELDAGLEHIRRSPKDDGTVELIVRRPAVGAREVLERGDLSLEDGLVGDSWKERDGNPETQIDIMNSRVAALIAQTPDRWALAGDQLYVDLDLSEDNLPPGIRLQVGSAILEVSAKPHTGCSKFVSHFGVDAMKFVNSPIGRRLHLRGINARVVRPGRVTSGSIIRRLQQTLPSSD